MHLKALFVPPPKGLTKTSLPARQVLLIMKFTAILLFTVCMQVSAGGYSQTVTLSGKNISLEKVFKEIKKQTGYDFWYEGKLIRQAKKVDIQAVNGKLEDVLNTCFQNQQLTYAIIEKTVVVKSKPIPVTEAPLPVLDIKGTVTGEGGKPLDGASVKLSGTDKGTVTDAKGNFSLQISDNGGLLVISYVGYETISMRVSKTGALDIKMKLADTKTEEIVVVGYGTQKRKEVSGAVASVKVNELSANASNNLTSALQGRVAGVSVESSGGAPGSGLSITVRGSGTLGNNSPLVVIDGIPFGSLDGLNPSDIQSIDILKDASAANIYGARAAGGVIMVTTKNGRRNTSPRIQFNAVYGQNSIPKRLGVMNSDQITKTFNDNGGAYPPGNGVNTNWQDEIFTTAPNYKANVDVTGGSENFLYSLSGSYLKQEGAVIHSDYTNANFRIKSVYEKGRVKVGETFIYNYAGGRDYAGGSADQTHSSIITSLVASPTVPVYDPNNPNGGWGMRPPALKNLTNIVAFLSSTQNKSNNASIIVDAFAEVRLIDQLKYRLNVGYSNYRGYQNNYQYPYSDGSTTINEPQTSMGSSLGTQWLVENILSYEKTIGVHHFSAMAGYSAQRDSSNGFGVTAYYPALGLYGISAATSWNKPNGSSSASTRTSQFGRVTYTFDNRYSLYGSLRQDASSIFDPEHNKGLFYGLSAAWNVTNEGFFRHSSLNKVIDFLKIRGGIGTLGNDRISLYTTQALLSTNMNFLTNGGMVIGSIPSGSQSPKDLTWEKSNTTNIGFDANLFAGRLSIVFDWFKKQSEGVLLSVPIPLSTGINGAPPVNAGNINNSGVELSINYGDKKKDWSYNIGWNMTAIKNKMDAVTIGSGNQQFGDIQRGIVGYALGSFFLIKNQGTFKTQQEIDAYTGHSGNKIQPNAQPGDLKFEDFNKDGIIDNNDQQYVGSPIPTFETGLSGNASYKSFDINILFQGVFGNKIYNGPRYWMEKMNEYTNFSSDALNAWTPTNNTSNFPRFILADPNLNARQNSDRWLEDGSYVRLKRLELGYTIAQQFTKNKLGMERIRFYLSGENLFTITSYSGFNPDLGNGGSPLSRGNDWGGYPIQRAIMIGVTASF
ncbi:TonB-dependent receptor [Flavihumibacter petaseus]|uniref:Putative TonB-dependent receptor n=1 Tax=Flavihumibacter petaseus NBRC 106054 TaxID=1220578 RepID=A0A0E9N020_9BACT|nr:TonB-dependent receptor [Flavihumibacter petaseus]GAO42725.1 putative TonB-dependent receptor [Flavihumibacter petaseus NBRC 106054]